MSQKFNTLTAVVMGMMMSWFVSPAGLEKVMAWQWYERLALVLVVLIVSIANDWRKS